MTERFHDRVEELKDQVLSMGNLAQLMLEESVTALVKQDVELAQKVIDHTDELARYDDVIEEQALRMIALNQPVAKDLRTVATILKVITYLNRIGRYGKDIARTAITTADKPHVAKLVGIPTMAKGVNAMVTDALLAFMREEIAPIEGIGERDDEIDELRRSIFRECITYMMEKPANITPCTNYVMVARYLERCGDHACKISEKVHYMITGERIEIT